MRRNHRFLGADFWVNLLLLIGLVMLLPAVGKAQAVGQQVEEAVLAEDWEKVAVLLDSAEEQTPSPVLRLIRAHAYLVLNRNNESLCSFLGVASEENFRTWAEWTRNFAEANTQQAIAHYLKEMPRHAWSSGIRL